MKKQICKNCKNPRKHNQQGAAYSYCPLFVDKKDPSGFKRIKMMDAACEMFNPVRGIFEELELRNVNHFVSVSTNRLRGENETNVTSDYDVCCFIEDMPNEIIPVCPDVRNLRMKHLKPKDILLFREMREEKYNRVQNNEDGQIYELKGRSFLDYFNEKCKNIKK